MAIFKRMRERLSAEHGASVVEMALVMLPLALLVAGAVDIGRAYHSYIIVINAAREGARYGARLPCEAANQAAVKAAIQQAAIDEAAGSGVALASGDITINPDPVSSGCAAANSPLQVTVRYTLATLLGRILGFNQMTVRGTTTMMAFGPD